MVAILCMAALQLVNFVRSAQFNEEIVSGSLVLLAQRLHNDCTTIAHPLRNNRTTIDQRLRTAFTTLAQ